MDARKKQILDHYGALRHALAANPLGNPKLEQLKLDMAKVKFDMEVNDLTEKDSVNYRKKSSQAAQKKRDTENQVAINKSLQKSILLLSQESC